MSLRRAAMRREKREREKALKSRSPDGELARAKEQGKIDGRCISVFIASVYLHENFGWGANKIIAMVEKGNREACRFDNAGVNFTINFYAGKVWKKIVEKNLSRIIQTKNIKEQMYYNERNDFFCTGLAVICTVLASEYNFGCKKSGVGRLDKLMDSCVDEFYSAMCDKKQDVDYYLKMARERAGINFTEGD